MEVRWSTLAVEDLEQICERIDLDHPETARKVAQTVYDGCARLADFPNLGRASRRMEGRYELVFSPLPYIAVYRITEHSIEISRIYHGAQDWPS
jgi:toxin ParE1/3/4